MTVSDSRHRHNNGKKSQDQQHDLLARDALNTKTKNAAHTTPPHSFAASMKRNVALQGVSLRQNTNPGKQDAAPRTK